MKNDMRLSELATGESAYIFEIEGSSAIKKRINEMGFIRGQRITAIKAAPFKDPIEFDIMGYKLSLRKKDAELIRIVSNPIPLNEDAIFKMPVATDIPYIPLQNKEEKTIKIALVGNPNCGKTTIFNFATHSKERVANYSGVTVSAKEAEMDFNNYKIKLIDLPGTYSLSSYSPEEIYVIDYLLNEKPDLIINVLDSSNMERNLYLTTQLLDLGINMVVALNMYDELTVNSGKLDINQLGLLLGIPFIPTIGTKGNGIKVLFEKAIQIFEKRDSHSRKINISYGELIDPILNLMSEKISEINPVLSEKSKFIALLLLEREKYVTQKFEIVPEWKELVDGIVPCRTELKNKGIKSISSEIVERRYAFINGALIETYQPGINLKKILSQKIDTFLTHKLWGLPLFFSIVWFIFFATFSLGQYPMNWLDSAIGYLGTLITDILPHGMASDLIIDGIIGGVGGVLVFIPNIMILFFLISVLEDSGYMARTAFLMDKVMHRVGLHGKSFIPLLMGFGCNVPAIMATRTIESKRDRMVTMFITPFMSCSARLPVYVLFISAFFPAYRSLMLFSMYAIGILAALITAILLNKTIFRRIDSPFVMELPPYRMPTFKSLSNHTWFKTLHFLKKMGTVILFASVVIWALGYFPRDKAIIDRYNNEFAKIEVLNSPELFSKLGASRQQELLEQSYISRLGKFIQPVFKPLGFDWRMSVSVLTGIMAKEIVVSSMGVLYQAGKNVDETSNTLINKLKIQREKDQTPLLAYFGFLVFILLYFPCMGTLVAIKKETEKFKMVFFSAIYPLVFAWIATFLIYQIGTLFL